MDNKSLALTFVNFAEGHPAITGILCVGAIALIVILTIVISKILLKIIGILRDRDLTIPTPIGKVELKNNPISSSQDAISSDLTSAKNVHGGFKTANTDDTKMVEMSLADVMEMVNKCVAIAMDIINVKRKIDTKVTDTQKLDTRSIMDTAISSIQVSYRSKLKDMGNSVLADPSVLLFNSKISSEFHEKVYPKLYDIYKSEDLAKKGTLEINELCISLSNTVVTMLKSNIISYVGCDLKSMEESIKDCTTAITSCITDSITKAKITAIEGGSKLNIALEKHNNEINDTIEDYTKERTDLTIFTSDNISGRSEG